MSELHATQSNVAWSGMPVMCTMNLPHLGVFNGSRLIVLKVHKSSTTGAPLFVICSVWREGDLSGREVVIPRAKVVSKSDDVPFGWVRQQFPLQLCFAMTINKAQGQTLRSRRGAHVACVDAWANICCPGPRHGSGEPSRRNAGQWHRRRQCRVQGRPRGRGGSGCVE